MPQKATLSHKQETFLLSYLSLPTMQAACVAAGISDETARRWLKLPEVQARYQELKQEYLDASFNALIRHTDTAIETLAGHMTDSETPAGKAGVQIRAAQLLLENVIALQKMSAVEKEIEMLKVALQQLTKEKIK